MKSQYFCFLLSLILTFTIVENKINSITGINSITNKLNFKKPSMRLTQSRKHSDFLQWSPFSIAEEINLETGIADPENFLGDQDKIKQIIEILNKIKNKHNINPFIIFLSELSSDYFDTKTKLKKTHSFLKDLSKALLKRYTINEDNTLIVLFSVKDRQSNIRSGYLLKKYFTKRDIERMLSDIIYELKFGKFTTAVEKVLQNISQILDQGGNKSYPSTIVFLLFIICVLFLVYWINKKVQKVKLAKSENVKKYKYKKLTIEAILLKFGHFNKLEKSIKELANEYCVLCLERCNKINEEDLKKDHENEFDILKTEEVQYEPITILDCGHYFHYDCANYWLSECLKECPSCKWKLEVDKDNFLKGMIRVQTKINKELLHYNLRVSGENIILSLPSIEEEEENDLEFKKDFRKDLKIEIRDEIKFK